MKAVAACVAFACVAVMTLSACGPKADAPQSGESGGGLMDGLFPKRTANYMAKYTMTTPQGSIDQTHYGSGTKRRVELSIAGITQASIMDPDTQTFLSFAIGPGAPKIATKIDAKAIEEMKQYEPDDAAAVKPKKVGTDTVAGEKCALWEVSAQAATSDPNAAPLQMCITDDGIMLRMGLADKPQMIATEVKRGPQDPKLFVLPDGYTVVDMGERMAKMQECAQAMQAGDKAKAAECQKLMMSGMGAP